MIATGAETEEVVDLEDQPRVTKRHVPVIPQTPLRSQKQNLQTIRI